MFEPANNAAYKAYLSTNLSTTICLAHFLGSGTWWRVAVGGLTWLLWQRKFWSSTYHKSTIKGSLVDWPFKFTTYWQCLPKIYYFFILKYGWYLVRYSTFCNIRIKNPWKMVFWTKQTKWSKQSRIGTLSLNGEVLWLELWDSILMLALDKHQIFAPVQAEIHTEFWPDVGLNCCKKFWISE